MYMSCLLRWQGFNVNKIACNYSGHDWDSVRTLQYVARCCGVLRCVAVYCSADLMAYPEANKRSKLSVLQCVALCCSVVQFGAVCCSVLQCVAVCRNINLIVYHAVNKLSKLRITWEWVENVSLSHIWKHRVHTYRWVQADVSRYHHYPAKGKMVSPSPRQKNYTYKLLTTSMCQGRGEGREFH
jgi:hypothetical protein